MIARFVAVMGASSLSFPLATWTEQLGDWIAGNDAAYSFLVTRRNCWCPQRQDRGDRGLPL